MGRAFAPCALQSRPDDRLLWRRLLRTPSAPISAAGTIAVDRRERPGGPRRAPHRASKSRRRDSGPLPLGGAGRGGQSFAVATGAPAGQRLGLLLDQVAAPERARLGFDGPPGARRACRSLNRTHFGAMGAGMQSHTLHPRAYEQCVASRAHSLFTPSARWDSGTAPFSHAYVPAQGSVYRSAAPATRPNPVST
jgi:hypothetical protein